MSTGLLARALPWSLLLALPLAAGAAGVAGDAAQAPTNVPDALTRASGLRLRPLAPAAQTYARNCQGCHGEGGVSVPEIPTLAGRVGYFARTPEGRAYLVQVPNVALNPGSDETIAHLLNWVLAAFSREQLPAGFVPYSAEEVGRLRAQRIDVAARRAQVVEQLLATGQIPSAEVLSRPGAPRR